MDSEVTLRSPWDGCFNLFSFFLSAPCFKDRGWGCGTGGRGRLLEYPLVVMDRRSCAIFAAKTYFDKVLLGLPPTVSQSPREAFITVWT